MIQGSHKAVIIGGSAGSFSVVCKIMSKLDPNFSIPIVLCLHRLKHVRSGLVEGINLKSQIKVKEPFDKEKIVQGNVYLAPSNYHLFIEYDHTFSLSTESAFNHSRPAIDYTFMSAAQVYREKCIGILLTGANKDGAAGLREINLKNGFTMVQDPDTCEIKTMPEAALKLFQPDKIISPDAIADFLNSLCHD